MSKNKRQLRAEAVERLEKLRRTEYSWDDVIEAMLAERDPRYTIVSQLIDLLADDEQPEQIVIEEPDTIRNEFEDNGLLVDDEAEQDSREKLEADLERLTNKWHDYDGNYMRIYSTVAYAQVKELLDRQAAITERQQRDWWGDVVAELIAERDELRNQVDEQPCVNGLREMALDYTERLGEAAKTLHIETQCTYDDLRVLCKTLMGVFE